VRHSDPLQYGIENNEIYIFEQDRSNGEEDSNMPFMIIGGDYAQSGVTTWYRIDFVNRIENETKNEFIDLTRNHGYNIVISEVGGKGYETREEAAQCLPVNTVTEILKFDDGDVENILFDGKYYLAISLETIEFDKNADSIQLKVKTDNPLGWKIQQQGGTGWLHIDRTEPSGPTDDGELKIKVDEHIESQSRQAAFHISAGRLEYTLPVEQSYLEGIALEITDTSGEPINEILFRSHPEGNFPTPNTDFVVKWKGPVCKIHVGMVGNRKIKLPEILEEGKTLIAGQEEFQITIPKPDPFTTAEVDPESETGTPFLEEGAAVTFEVANGTETIKRTIYIRHQCVNMVFDNLEELCYMGHEYTFKVRSNTTWRVTKAETEEDNVFQTVSGDDYQTVINTTGGNDIRTGTSFTTRIIKPEYHYNAENYGIGKAGRKLHLTFTDEDGICPDRTKTFIATLPDANSFTVMNGGGAAGGAGDGKEGRGGYILIPLRKLFWIWEKHLDRELNPAVSGPLNLRAEIIWESFNGLLQNNMQFDDYGGKGDYRDYTLFLWSANSTANRNRRGNALIAIKNGNETLWSFHIWVTNYFPDHGNGTTFNYNGGTSPIFMNYNLGATIDYTQFNPHQGTTPPAGSPEINGLYYQHGRKDPFPGPRAGLGVATSHRLDQNPENVLETLVKPDGSRMIPTYPQVAEEKNLRNSINNPTTYYLGHSDLMDWYTNGPVRGYQNDYLWIDKDSRKGMYDPCPAGWRTPVYKPNDVTGFEKLHQWVNDAGSYVIQTPNSSQFYFPATGYIRKHSTGGYPDIRNYRIAGYLVYGDTWAGISVAINGRSGEFIINASVYGRASGTPVRCKKDTYDWYGQHY
ncbi:MAG: BACON domain-containing protein, partial [Tannerellaceae bacterium]|nr:BACON domain-containing protein [Tannerellaceae bacterium]